MGSQIVRIYFQRLVEKCERLLGLLGNPEPGVRQCLKIEIVCIEVFRPLSLGALDFRLPDGGLDGAGDALGYPVLQVEHVL